MDQGTQTSIRGDSDYDSSSSSVVYNNLLDSLDDRGVKGRLHFPTKIGFQSSTSYRNGNGKVKKIDPNFANNGETTNGSENWITRSRTAYTLRHSTDGRHVKNIPAKPNSANGSRNTRGNDNKYVPRNTFSKDLKGKVAEMHLFGNGVRNKQNLLYNHRQHHRPTNEDDNKNDASSTSATGLNMSSPHAKSNPSTPRRPVERFNSPATKARRLGQLSHLPKDQVSVRHCDACSLEYVRSWVKTNRGKSSTTTNDSGITENGPTIAEHDRWATKRVLPHAFHEPLQLVSTRYDYDTLETTQNQRMKGTNKNHENPSTRQAVNIRTVSVPRKGRIKLTALPYELDNPDYFDDQREAAEKRDFLERYHEQLLGPALPPASPDSLKGTLIRNKSILKQVKSDVKRLEQDTQYHQARLNIEDDVIPSLVGDLLDYEMSEVPHINSHLQDFLHLQTNHNNKWYPNSSSVPTPTGDSSMDMETYPPDTARSLPEVTITHKANGTTSPRKHFNEVIRRIEFHNDSGRNLGQSTPNATSCSGLWQMSDVEKAATTPRNESTLYNTDTDYHPGQGMSLHNLLQNAQKIACSHLRGQQIGGSKALTFPVIDFGNTKQNIENCSNGKRH